MSEWKDKSNFEINKLVATAKGLDVSGATEDNNKMYDYVNDYCNSPADAWSIIVENKISIHHDIARYSASSLVYDKKFENGFKVFNYNGEIGDISSRAALRAAMIVYLEMNGVKP